MGEDEIKSLPGLQKEASAILRIVINFNKKNSSCNIKRNRGWDYKGLKTSRKKKG